MSIESYLKSKELAWSPATIHSEGKRLRGNIKYLSMAPEEAYKELIKTHKPYTIKTMFIRFNDYLKWKDGNEDYGIFLKKSARLFRDVYEKRRLSFSFLEASRAIDGINDEQVRIHAKFLLNSGLRISESYKASDTVRGKGNKVRKVFVDTPNTLVSETKLRRALRPLGLTPHALRKLCATRLVEMGASPQDLCEIMGWSNLSTAYHYLQPKKEEELRRLINANV